MLDNFRTVGVRLQHVRLHDPLAWRRPVALAVRRGQRVLTPLPPPQHGAPQSGEATSAALEEPEETQLSEVQPAPQEASPSGREAGTAPAVLAFRRFAATYDARALTRDGARAARLAHERVVDVHHVDTELGNAGPPVGEATAALHVGRRTWVCAGLRGAHAVVGHEFNGLTAGRVWPLLDDGVWLVGGEAGP